jgi:hypothetical protein
VIYCTSPLHGTSHRQLTTVLLPHCRSHRDYCFFPIWRNSPQWARASAFTKFLDHSRRHITVGRTALDEWSARRRDLYLTTHNSHNRHPWPRGSQTHNLSRRAAADLRLRPRGHWNRLIEIMHNSKYLWSLCKQSWGCFYRLRLTLRFPMITALTL